MHGVVAPATALVFDGSQSAPLTAEHVARLRSGGIQALHLTIGDVHAGFAATVRATACALQTLESLSADVVHVRTFGDFERASRERRIGVVLALQHAPIESGIDDVVALHALGVRTIQLTYNARNPLGDGCVEEPDGGLSRYGRLAVRAMNRVGVTIDLSHCGDHTTQQAIAASERPVLVAHANARAVCESPRNKSDETLRLLAANGGVIGATFWSPMTHNGRGRRPTVAQLLDQVDYLVEVAGIEHVGVGSDIGEGQPRAGWDASFGPGGRYASITDPLRSWFSYETRMVDGLESAASFGRVREVLEGRGYTPNDIAKLLGGNVLRVFAAAWA